MHTHEEAKHILKHGGIGVMPTDTLYGVIGRALDKTAVERVYAAKEREPEKPFIVLISDQGALEQFGVHIDNNTQEKLAEYWPGPTSIIMPCPDNAFTYLHRGTHTLAFRVPNDEALRTFLTETGPLVAPSANTAGEAPAHTIAEARAYFADTVDFYIDGGEITGEPSTLISMTGDKPVVLRKGGE